jgi:hypothetical protein
MGVDRRTVNVAVDGTSHSVQLATGAHLILSVAAAHGPAYCADERADMEILPARFDDGQASSARDLMMRSLEAESAGEVAKKLRASGDAARAILWIDGSLYADLAHMAGAPGKVQWGTLLERAGHLLKTTAGLFDLAERSGLWLVGIGKTQRAGFLFDALSSSAMGGEPPRERRRGDEQAEDDGRPADGELLAAMGTGWSWPLILDGRRFPITSNAAQEALKECPAVISTYVRPHPADLPLRIDLPASALGLEDRLMPHLREETGRPWPAWLPDPAIMRPVLEAALAAYGGISVYNAPLYAVDKMVRLPRRELEVRYLPICEKIAGLQPGSLGINRGRRRFLIA